MQEVMENLIVKCGKMLPTGIKIPGKKIDQWKKYTIQYFKKSPNSFLADNEFYQTLSEKIQIQLFYNNMCGVQVDDSSLIIPIFLQKFDIFLEDKEFGFKADEKLGKMILSSLQYQFVDPEESIIKIGQKSTGIYFILDGNVDVYYKLNDQKLLVLREGSYFGEVSYIFKTYN